ncbi:MAG: hypothetical protein R2755_32995 [Acidimicrobiales bacterium]
MKALLFRICATGLWESFLTLIESRMTGDGLYLLDEPESALSFRPVEAVGRDPSRRSAKERSSSWRRIRRC